MKLKTLSIVVVVLAGATAAVWFARKDAGSAPETDPRVGKPILDTTIISTVAGVHLRSQGKDITLVNKEPAGAAWIVREYHDMPADFSKISDLIQKLRDAKIVAFASSNPQRIARMEFGDSVLELKDKDDKVVWSANIGRTAENELRFIKFGGEEKTYRATFSAWLDSTPKNWADPVIVPVKPERVTGLDVEFPSGGGSLQLKRDKPESPWKVEGLATGETVRDSEVSSLLTKLAGLRFTESTEPTAPDAVAARAAARTFKLTTVDGKEYTVALGRRPAPPAPPPPPPPPPAADGTKAPEPVTPPAPQPGPVYAFVHSSASNEPINGMMERLGFQIAEWTFTGLPADRAALIQAAPPPPPPAPAAPASPAPTESAPPSSTAPATPASPSP